MREDRIQYLLPLPRGVRHVLTRKRVHLHEWNDLRDSLPRHIIQCFADPVWRKTQRMLIQHWRETVGVCGQVTQSLPKQVFALRRCGGYHVHAKRFAAHFRLDNRLRLRNKFSDDPAFEINPFVRVRPQDPIGPLCRRASRNIKIRGFRKACERMLVKARFDGEAAYRRAIPVPNAGASE